VRLNEEKRAGRRGLAGRTVAAGEVQESAPPSEVLKRKGQRELIVEGDESEDSLGGTPSILKRNFSLCSDSSGGTFI